MEKATCMAGTVVLIAALGMCQGCEKPKTIRYHESTRNMANSGLCTLVGTAKERILADFGSPDDDTFSTNGQEVLHYVLTGTITSEKWVPLFGTRVTERETTENLYVDLKGGVVVGGRWEQANGVSRW